MKDNFIILYLPQKLIAREHPMRQSVIRGKKSSIFILFQGFPGSAVVQNPPAMQRTQERCWFNPCVEKIPQRRKWQPILVFLPEKSHGQRCLEGYCPEGSKKSDMTEQLSTLRILNNISTLLTLSPSLNLDKLIIR